MDGKRATTSLTKSPSFKAPAVSIRRDRVSKSFNWTLITRLTSPTQPAPSHNPEPGSIWLQRIKIVIEVVFFIELGMLLIILPWTPLWSQNSLFGVFPGLRFFLGNGFVRGLVTGLGFVNLWMGISDAVNYRES